MDTKEKILKNKTYLGIELGSTRIKAILIDEEHQTIATGGHEWENQLVEGYWTYSLESVKTGLQDCYRKLADEIREKYDIPLKSVGAIGISAMMHGYLVFDENDQQLVPFRTWRNTTTAAAEKCLTELFQYNIPQRWSIAHLYQAILNQEEHVPQVAYMTTLSGYLHWLLTGEKVIGIGDASGMFPIDSQTKQFDKKMLQQFNELIQPTGLSWQIEELLPTILVAGEAAGSLTRSGAELLDPTGVLQGGIPLCPPEGDAGTGMVATNAVTPRSGNVSAGTSAFAMIVLERPLQHLHPEIDLVTTPTGSMVGMVHTNNCSTEIDAWVKLFGEFAEAAGIKLSMAQLFELLFNKALAGDSDFGGLLSYGYHSGEHITNMTAGRPLLVRRPESRFDLANLMRVQLFTAFGAMKIGMEILQKEESVAIDRIVGHGGIFKTPIVGQRVLAAVMNAPVTVMATAGEGGAWGIAVLAAFMATHEENETLDDYLANKVFKEDEGSTIPPVASDVADFERFLVRYRKGLAIETQALLDL